MKINFKRTSVLLMTNALVESPIVVTTGSGLANANTSAEQTTVKYLSNQDLFDAFEKNGYELEDIQSYKAEDKLRARKTQYVETSGSTSTLYLSSAYTKTIAALGAGATTIIGGFIGGGFLGSIASSNLNTNKGIYLKFKSQKNAAGQYILVGNGCGYQ